MAESIFDIFREEAREHLSALEKGFLDLEAVPAERRRSLIDLLFRHAHSIKGDARAVGLVPLKEASQVLEDVLDSLRQSPEDVTSEHVNQGLAQLDLVRGAFEDWQRGDHGQRNDVSQESVAIDNPNEVIAAAIEPARGESEVVPPGSIHLELATATGPHVQSGPGVVAANAPQEEAFTIRVSSDRLDRMLNVAGEIRITQRSIEATQGRLADLIDHLDLLTREHERGPSADTGKGLEYALDQARRIAGDVYSRRVTQELLIESLQADIRQARLLPLLMLTDSLRRAVRDLSQLLNKFIRYEVDVGQILLDKAVIEALKDPLLHLIRNAADHGLERPDERRKSGKRDEGTIRIHAAQQGPLVRICVSDDGRGVDFDRIRARLRNSGEVDETNLSTLSEREMIAYLFQPGFTTATAGDISGRGVGLDVVTDSIRRLQGTVSLERTSDAGTTFVITVPVTTSTIRILTVVTGGQTFGIPSSTVARTGRACRSELLQFQGGLVLNMDGQSLPWRLLADMLDVTSQRAGCGDTSWPYLVTTQDQGAFAVAVDELEEESEVLLKPLGFPLGGLPGILGGTIRADGSVQLVLDLPNMSLNSDVRSQVSEPREDRARRIMVVDDSPTTRAIMRNVFTAAGYSVVTATDGIDALERLRLHRVDLVVSDVEMPRLNGFDLTRQIKAKSDLPVILVTGREKEEHRREGLEAGADGYVIKSTFEEGGLLQLVEQWI